MAPVRQPFGSRHCKVGAMIDDEAAGGIDIFGNASAPERDYRQAKRHSFKKNIRLGLVIVFSREDEYVERKIEPGLFFAIDRSKIGDAIAQFGYRIIDRTPILFRSDRTG